MNNLTDSSDNKQQNNDQSKKYPTWIRWLLAKWWGLVGLILLGLLTNILLLPLAQGFAHWGDRVFSQVAELIALPHTKPAITIIGLLVVITLTAAGYLADQAIKRNEKQVAKKEIQHDLKEPLDNMTEKMLTAVQQGFQDLNITMVGNVTIETFSIDPKKCQYKQHSFDPMKPLWPEEDHGAVGYGPGNIIEMYGREFSSREDAEAYGKLLEESRNHRSFSKDSLQKIYFERLQGGKGKNKANYPVFYMSVRNTTKDPIILSTLEAEVIASAPLASVGKSHTLEPLAKYELEIGSSLPMIPSIKAAPKDAAAFEVLLKPRGSRVGSYSRLMKLRIYFSDRQYVETVPFEIIL